MKHLLANALAVGALLVATPSAAQSCPPVREREAVLADIDVRRAANEDSASPARLALAQEMLCIARTPDERAEANLFLALSLRARPEDDRRYSLAAMDEVRVGAAQRFAGNALSRLAATTTDTVERRRLANASLDAFGRDPPQSVQQRLSHLLAATSLFASADERGGQDMARAVSALRALTSAPEAPVRCYAIQSLIRLPAVAAPETVAAIGVTLTGQEDLTGCTNIVPQQARSDAGVRAEVAQAWLAAERGDTSAIDRVVSAPGAAQRLALLKEDVGLYGVAYLMARIAALRAPGLTERARASATAAAALDSFAAIDLAGAARGDADVETELIEGAADVAYDVAEQWGARLRGTAGPSAH